MKAICLWITLAILGFSISSRAAAFQSSASNKQVSKMIGYKTRNHTSTNVANPIANQVSGKVPRKEIGLKNGISLVVSEEHPVGLSLSTVRVSIKSQKGSQLIFEDIDPIKKILKADLNEDGQEEIYLISQAAATGIYANLFGIAVLGKKALAKINIPTIETNDLAWGGAFYGYEGHDDFNIKGNGLIRTFPIRNQGSASKRTVLYQLMDGESGPQLRLKNSTVF